MNVELKILAKNDNTALPRVLRLVSRQGYCVKKLVMQPMDDDATLELFLLLDTNEMPMRLVKLLQKQIVVFDVQAQRDNIPVAV